MGSHHHHHDHHHGHDHGNHHDHDKLSFAFKFGIALNLLFTIVEVIYGISSNSLALIADAGHNFSDVLGLIIAYIATILIKKKASSKFTFGLRGSSIISALLNAIILFIALGGIFIEAIHRFQTPAALSSQTMMIVAGIGIIINFSTAMFFKTHHHDLNAKSAFLHLMSDALISLGVVLAGFFIKTTGITFIDPLVSIIISIIIAKGTWNIFKEALFLSINATPENININEVENYLKNINSVSNLHDLHIWALSTTENALTVHLVISDNKNNDELLLLIKNDLKNKFKITHSTIQIENKFLNCHNDITCYQS